VTTSVNPKQSTEAARRLESLRAVLFFWWRSDWWMGLLPVGRQTGDSIARFPALRAHPNVRWVVAWAELVLHI